jgi:hypothetical protein
MHKIIAVLCFYVLSFPTTLRAQPKLYHVVHGASNLYILGGTEVPDTAWFDVRIQRALGDSSTLWA